MTDFSITRNIPPCFVTKDLIENLEEYIFSTICTELAKDLKLDYDEISAKLSEKLNIIIRDGIGTETLTTIKDYKLIKFSDTTDKINVRFSSSYLLKNTNFRLNINFDKRRHLADIELQYEGKNAKEFSSGFIDGVLSRIKMNKTSNWIYHPPAIIEGVLFTLAIMYSGVFTSQIVIYLIKQKNLLDLVPWFSLFAVLIFYQFLSGKLKPYITFDTNRTEKIEFSWRFLWTGLIGFILFSIVAPFILNQLKN